jgi:hypothetical protein
MSPITGQASAVAQFTPELSLHEVGEKKMPTWVGTAFLLTL